MSAEDPTQEQAERLPRPEYWEDFSDPTKLAAGYQFNLAKYEKLCAEVEFALKEIVKRADVQVHSVSARVKTLDSIATKTKRKKLRNPFVELTDIVAGRIVVLFIDDVERIAVQVRSGFDILKEDDKIAASDDSTFDYMGVHFDARLGYNQIGFRYEDIHGLTFEIQVRTVAMDTWAALSHYLGYKDDDAVPEDLRKDFHALSGMFYVADKHFELFYRQARRRRARRQLHYDLAEQGEELIPLTPEAVQTSINARYPDRAPAAVDAAAELVEELKPLGYASLQEVTAKLYAGDYQLKEYERRYFPRGDDRRFAAIGAARTSLFLADDEYRLTRVFPPNEEEMAPFVRLVALRMHAQELVKGWNERDEADPLVPRVDKPSAKRARAEQMRKEREDRQQAPSTEANEPTAETPPPVEGPQDTTEPASDEKPNGD